jgi:hypothetical protein
MVISSLLAQPLWLAQEETPSSFQEGVLSMMVYGMNGRFNEKTERESDDAVAQEVD